MTVKIQTARATGADVSYYVKIDGLTYAFTDAKRGVSVGMKLPLDADCEGCWRIDETSPTAATLADSGPHGYDMAVRSSYYGIPVGGKFTGARKSTYAKRCWYRASALAPNTELVLTDAVTIAGWMQFHGSDDYPTNADGSIVGMQVYNGGQYFSYGIKFNRVDDGGIRRYRWTGEICVDVGGVLTSRGVKQVDYADVGAWNLVGVTYDRTTITLWVNAEPVATYSENRAITYPVEAERYFTLVNYVDPPSVVDDVAVYSTVKSQQWWTKVYNAALPCLIPPEDELSLGLDLRTMRVDASNMAFRFKDIREP